MKAPPKDGRMVVYVVTCGASGRRYVGVTCKTSVERWTQHVHHARSGRLNTPFHQAIREFGTDHFALEDLFIANSRVDAGWAEKLFIEQFQTVCPAGFNRTHGGEPNERWSDAAKAKASASHKGKPWTEAKREKMRIIQQSPEYRAKMRAAAADRPRPPLSDATKQKLRDATIRQLSSPEARAALSEKAKKRMADPARRAHLREVAFQQRSDPMYVARQAAGQAVALERPGVREGQSERQKKRMQNPEARNKIAASMRNRHADPEYRARFLATRRGRWSSSITTGNMGSQHCIMSGASMEGRK